MGGVVEVLVVGAEFIEERLITDCDARQLAAAGVIVEMDDAGGWCYVWAATGETVLAPERRLVSVPVTREDVLEDPSEGLDDELLGEEVDPRLEALVPAPRRRLRVVLSSTLVLVLCAGVGTALWPSPEPTTPMPTTPLGVPLQPRPVSPLPPMPVSVVTWSTEAQARLAETELRLTEARAATEAWDAQSEERRVGEVPPEVSELQERVGELQRQKTVLETDLAAVATLHAMSGEIIETQDSLSAVERALAAPPAPPDEATTARLVQQRDFLAAQRAITQQETQRYQADLQAAAAVPLPEVAESAAPERVMALTRMPGDPTPEPVEQAPLAVRSEDTESVVEVEDVPEPLEPDREADAEDVSTAPPEVVTPLRAVEPVTEVVEEAVPVAVPLLETEAAERSSTAVVEPTVERSASEPEVPSVSRTAPSSVVPEASDQRVVDVTRAVAAESGACGDSSKLAPGASAEEVGAALSDAGSCVVETLASVSPEDRAAIEGEVARQLEGWEPLADTAVEEDASTGVDAAIAEISRF